MPLFVWMSGYFYKKRGFGEELRKIIPLIEVCIISHIGFALLRDGRLSVGNMLFFGYTPSWYLLSLVYWRLASSLLFKYVDVRKLLIYALVVEIFSFVFINKYGGLLSLMRTLQFYPYFVVGYMMKNRLGNMNKYGKIILSGGVIAIAFILLTSSRLQHQVDFQRAGLLELAATTDLSVISLFVFRYAVIISSVMISGAILVWTSRSNLIKRVANYGQYTLFVYFSQTLIYAVLSRYNLLFYQSLALTILAVPLLTYIATKKFSKLMMNPIDYLIKK